MSSTDLTPSEHRELLKRVNAYLEAKSMYAVMTWTDLMKLLKELKAKRRGTKQYRKYKARRVERLSD